MIDKVKQLTAIITANCNSKCVHCTYWKNKSKNFLDKEIFFKTILSLKKLGLESVMMTGGEPFLHPYVVEFIDFLYKHNLRIKFATNGILIDKINLRDLKKVDSFSVPLDSLTRKTYHKIRGVDKFDEIIKNVKMLKQFKKNVKFSFLIQNKNYNEIPLFLDLCNSLKIKEISFLVPNKNGEFNKSSFENYDKILLSNEELSDFEKNTLPIIKKKLKRYKISSNYKISNLKWIVEYFRCFDKQFRCSQIRYAKCPFPINNLVLTEKGTFKPCLFMPYEYENLLVKNGNINKINKLRNEYLFKKGIFEKYCAFCLEVPLE